MKALLLALVSLVGCGFAAEPFRAYFIGNSVTDTLRYGQLAKLAAARDIQLQWGRHMIPGAPLEWIHDHPADGFTEDPYGQYPKALGEFAWDAVSVQPFDRQLKGRNEDGEERGDIAMIRTFAEMAAKKNPAVQIHLYARWPRITVKGENVPYDKNDHDPTRPGSGTDLSKVDDFTTRWEADHTGGWDLTNETRDYFDTLLTEVRKATPNLEKPILLVPVGHVMADLHRQMKAGKIKGWSTIHQFYRDGIHLNEPGSYAVACTYFACLFKQSPVGLPTDPYGSLDPELARAIQETAWRVVSSHPESGVTADR